MKSVADMKRRLKVGGRLLCVENTYQTKLNGGIRTIVRVLGNQIVCDSDTVKHFWTRWPPAKDFTFIDADTFQFKLDTKDPHTVTLRFLPEVAPLTVYVLFHETNTGSSDDSDGYVEAVYATEAAAEAARLAAIRKAIAEGRAVWFNPDAPEAERQGPDDWDDDWKVEPFDVIGASL